MGPSVPSLLQPLVTILRNPASKNHETFRFWLEEWNAMDGFHFKYSFIPEPASFLLHFLQLSLSKVEIGKGAVGCRVGQKGQTMDCSLSEDGDLYSTWQRTECMSQLQFCTSHTLSPQRRSEKDKRESWSEDKSELRFCSRPEYENSVHWKWFRY